MKIAVLMGGDSPERDVSLASGKAVAAGLRNLGHEVEAIDIPSVAAVLDLQSLEEVDVVFPALHGGQGEDGHLQSVLDVLQVPYALSGPLASALAMDKCATKRLMRGAGIPTPDWLHVIRDKQSDVLTTDKVLERVTDELGFPCVIKLNGAGSSVGVEIVETAGDFEEAWARVLAAEERAVPDILIEKFIPGRELTVAIFLGRRLPLLEIRPQEGFYDYSNKYTPGHTEYLVPAPVHSPQYEQISADALRLYELLGCQGLARVDFRLDGGDYACLEINTIPGMTETSLVPKAAAVVGIGFDTLVEDLCQAALRHATARGRDSAT